MVICVIGSYPTLNVILALIQQDWVEAEQVGNLREKW